MSCKLYLAGPFFSKEQVELIDRLERIVDDHPGWSMFSPRRGENAKEMNATLAAGCGPSQELRQAVFDDNVNEIDSADLLVAVIDDFDTGTMFEMGYAFKAQVPIVTYTARDYGCNLMLAHSIIGHVKNEQDLQEVLAIGSPALRFDASVAEYGAAIATIQSGFKTLASLKEGPDERA